MTADATRFVGPLTFSALASEPARTSLWDGPEPIPHTRLGQGADLIVVAPATARVIGAYASGISDDLLVATLLATRAPVMVCPAMHTEMWEHPAVQDNLELLRARGVHIIEPAVGRLAGGDEGPGRLAEPERIAAAITDLLSASPARDLTGLRIVVTAGGTREPIDPVRFIGNRSSGKQGCAIAEEAAARGAKVSLVTTVDLPSVVTLDVPELLLEPTPDILAGLGHLKRPDQLLIGFAAETTRGSDLVASAREKLRAKNLDLVVANDVSAPRAGFEHDTNAAVIVGADGTVVDVPLSPKRAVARSVLDAVAARRFTTHPKEQQ